MVKRVAAAASLALALSACQDESFNRSARHLSAIPPATLALMTQRQMSKSDPIVIRSYKKESEMEVWKRGADGRFVLLKTYPICRWSGQLGPKVREGDRQAPEGFYTITPAQMNPNSSYYLSFDTGYPNAFDRAHGRSGSFLMVHGSCSSRGCFAMTDDAIAEVYAIAREAFAGGQRTFQFQSYPFRMTAQNLAQHRYDPNMPFWRNLKEGADHFDALGEEPKVAVCGRRYVFGGADVARGNCAPEVSPAVAQKRERDERQVAELVAKGVQPIKLVYEDGGQHQSFRQALVDESGSEVPLVVSSRDRLGMVSRPESLATGPQQILLDVNGKPKETTAALGYASTRQGSAATSPPGAASAGEAKVGAATPPSTKTPVREPVATAAGDGSPFYRRMFTRIGDLLSASDPPEPEPPAPPAPAPRRGPGAAKPQASATAGRV
jgi:murein L,D-transpeptidase YafK